MQHIVYFSSTFLFGISCEYNAKLENIEFTGAW